MKLGGENMDKKEWEKRDLTAEEIEQRIEELEAQILAFELRVRYEDKQNAFRDVYMAWYEGRLNLGELLDAMMDRSICKRITPFARR
jgi:hypothetical protein